MISEKQKNELKQHIHNWIQIDRKNADDINNINLELKQLNKKAKELRDQRKELEEEKKSSSDEIVKFLKDRELDYINTREGKLVYKCRITKKSFTKSMITELITGYFGPDEEGANHLIQHLNDNRGENITDVLKLHPADIASLPNN